MEPDYVFDDFEDDYTRDCERAVERLRETFDTYGLLDALDHLDQIRYILADGPNLEPPEVREELLRLHRLAAVLINDNYSITFEKATPAKLFDLVDDIEHTVFEIYERAEGILDVLHKLRRPLGLSDAEWEERQIPEQKLSEPDDDEQHWDTQDLL